MTNNKKIVSDYIEGFRKSDHAKILSCLTDNVTWEMPGFFNLHGKEEFDKEIENEAFTGKPEISITRLIEEGNIVVAEGTVQAKKKDGGNLTAVFCDVFHFEDEKIKHLTSYLMEIKT